MFYITRFKDIEKREYECEVVTPLFLGGADPQKAELRAPPIKAAMRFWWRAMHPKDIKNLRDNEAMLFGDAGDEYGKSNLSLAIKDFRISNGEYQPLPHHEAKPKNFKIQCINGSFKVVIKGATLHHSIFKLFCLLGGIGKRSRRGFGSIHLVNIEGQSYKKDAKQENIFTLIDNICPNEFLNIGDVIKRKQTITGINYPYLKEIKIGKPVDTFQDLLKSIGKASHDHNSDYTGFAKGKKRFASPVYVSIKRNDQKYVPVISVLNTAFADNTGHGKDNSSDFIKAVINAGGAK